MPDSTQLRMALREESPFFASFLWRSKERRPAAGAPPEKVATGATPSEHLTVKRDILNIHALPGNAKTKAQTAHTKAHNKAAIKKAATPGHFFISAQKAFSATGCPGQEPSSPAPHPPCWYPDA